jgi:hypothetical protein
MPFGSLPWLCVNRWPNEGRARSMREAWWYGSVFRRDPCLIEDGVRGESPSYRNHLFVGAASAATFVSSRMEVWD